MREEIAYQEMQAEMSQQKTRQPDMKVDEASRAVDERDAHHASGPDRMPTAEEERAAEREKLPAGAGAAYKEALERGAHRLGEGKIE